MQIGLPTFLQLLDSTFDYASISDLHTSKLLQHLQKPKKFYEIPLHNLDKYQIGWHQVQEMTSPLGWCSFWTLHGWG